MRIFAFLVLLIPTLALANDPDIDDTLLEWDLANQRVDGTDLKPEEIDGYIVRHNGTGEEVFVEGALTLSYIWSDTGNGLHIFTIATVSEGQTGPFSYGSGYFSGPIPKDKATAPGLKAKLVCAQQPCENEVK